MASVPIPKLPSVSVANNTCHCCISHQRVTYDSRSGFTTSKQGSSIWCCMKGSDKEIENTKVWEAFSEFVKQRSGQPLEQIALAAGVGDLRGRIVRHEDLAPQEFNQIVEYIDNLPGSNRLVRTSRVRAPSIELQFCVRVIYPDGSCKDLDSCIKDDLLEAPPPTEEELKSIVQQVVQQIQSHGPQEVDETGHPLPRVIETSPREIFQILSHREDIRLREDAFSSLSGDDVGPSGGIRT